jgi:hypothetical protein
LIATAFALLLQVIRPAGSRLLNLLRSAGPNADRPHARKLQFAETIQCDLGRPVLPAEIFRFLSTLNP